MVARYLVPVPVPPGREHAPRSFRRYLKRPPVAHLLAVIGAAVMVHVGLGYLLGKTTSLVWWQGYFISASCGIATAAALVWFFHRRARKADQG